MTQAVTVQRDGDTFKQASSGGMQPGLTSLV